MVCSLHWAGLLVLFFIYNRAFLQASYSLGCRGQTVTPRMERTDSPNVTLSDHGNFNKPLTVSRTSVAQSIKQRLHLLCHLLRNVRWEIVSSLQTENSYDSIIIIC